MPRRSDVPLLRRQLGPRGIRVVEIHAAAVREPLTAEKIAAVSGDAAVDVDALIEMIASRTMLRRTPGCSRSPRRHLPRIRPRRRDQRGDPQRDLRPRGGVDDACDADDRARFR
jgi:hypothetical protein